MFRRVLIIIIFQQILKNACCSLRIEDPSSVQLLKLDHVVFESRTKATQSTIP
jgi:hypothetical protein